MALNYWDFLTTHSQLQYFAPLDDPPGTSYFFHYGPVANVYQTSFSLKPTMEQPPLPLNYQDGYSAYGGQILTSTKAIYAYNFATWGGWFEIASGNQTFQFPYWSSLSRGVMINVISDASSFTVDFYFYRYNGAKQQVTYYGDATAAAKYGAGTGPHWLVCTSEAAYNNSDMYIYLDGEAMPLTYGSFSTYDTVKVNTGLRYDLYNHPVYFDDIFMLVGTSSAALSASEIADLYEDAGVLPVPRWYNKFDYKTFITPRWYNKYDFVVTERNELPGEFAEVYRFYADIKTSGGSLLFTAPISRLNIQKNVSGTATLAGTQSNTIISATQAQINSIPTGATLTIRLEVHTRFTVKSSLTIFSGDITGDKYMGSSSGLFQLIAEAEETILATGGNVSGLQTIYIQGAGRKRGRFIYNSDVDIHDTVQLGNGDQLTVNSITIYGDVNTGLYMELAD